MATRLGSRVYASMRAGFSAARQTWNARALVPDSPDQWDAYTARLFRYAHWGAYYDNTIYTSLIRYAAQHRAAAHLYKHTRGVYNPVTRLVDMYVDKVYGGVLDTDTLETGAVPIADASPGLIRALRQVWVWSNWGVKKSLYVRTGTKCGDVALKIVDDRQRQKVRLEVLHPGKIRDVVTDDVGNVKTCVIEYERVEKDASGRDKTYVYTETIDKEMFRTFKDGEPFAYYTDMEGRPVFEWANEYGFVPLVLCQHKDVGLDWGAPPFHASWRKIDELNDSASLINDYIRKAVVPMWWGAGIRKKEDLVVSQDERDQIPFVYAPANSQPYPMVFPMDVSAALANIQELQQEIERDMPELALHRLRSSGADLTAPGIRAGFNDAIDKIQEARGNYDDALVRAQQMAVSIGGYNRYAGFEGFNLDSYDAGALVHRIAERPVIEDQLTIQERMQFLISSKAPDRAVWRELNIPAAEIKQWEQEKQEALDAFNARLDTEETAEPNTPAQDAEEQAA